MSDSNEKLRRLREWVVKSTHYDSWGCEVHYGIVKMIDRLLAEPEVVPQEQPGGDVLRKWQERCENRLSAGLPAERWTKGGGAP